MRLRFKAREVHALARRYSFSSEVPLVEIGRRARVRGHLTAQELRTIARWKTPRSAPRVERNADDFVRAITAVMLSTESERLRVEVLTLLQGVNWPTASVILHFVYPDRYPILDFRALWSLSFSRPPAYNFEFWSEYVAFTRREARRLKVSMRELDRALWQYSKERQ